jgi:hypothetical protein
MASTPTAWRWDSLRLLAAGLFVFVSTSGLVVLLSWLFPKVQSWPVVPIAVLAFFAIIFAALILFHGKWTHRPSEEEILAERLLLEQPGMLISEPYRALRAFQLEEFEDEGSQYFLELEDHSVLYLSGQFLYEYEPLNEKPRRFPCAQFTIRRHKDDGYIVDLLCSGEILEPEITAPPLALDELEKYGAIADGQIIQGKSYDELKAERLATTRNRR